MGKRLEQTFHLRRLWMAHKPVKRCSASLVIRKMEMKATMTYHCTPIRMATSKQNPDDTKS